MTEQIHVLPDDQSALYNQHEVERRVGEQLDDGYVETEDYPCPGFDVFAGSPEEADTVLSFLEREYPDFSVLYE